MRRVFPLLAPLALLAGTPAAGEEPALCADVVAAHEGDPLEALAEAEQAKLREARRVERERRKLAKKTLGRGRHEGALGIVGQINDATDHHLSLVREARDLCRCREARGDPNRSDCDALYAGLVPGR